MASKNVCSVPLTWTLADYNRHSCRDGSHCHISYSEAASHEKKNILTWMRRSMTRRENSIVQIQVLAVRDDSWAGRPSNAKSAGEPLNSGLSNRVGPYLAKRVRQKCTWAIVMLAEINMRPAREEVV